MKKAYLIYIKKIEATEVYVLANSGDEAVAMVTEDTQCIEDYDYDTDTEIFCVDEDDLKDLSPTRVIYDNNLNRTTVGKIKEGGEE